MPIRILIGTAALIAAGSAASAEGASPGLGLSYGPRPAYLVDKLSPGPLKDELMACLGQEVRPSAFSIGHRGAPLMFPEHTVESNRAAARQGAGILECDVTFTADRELVCRHAQDDLHMTTNILTTELASKCTAPFTPAEGETEASAECRTSDITLAEFETLRPKMDSYDGQAATAEEYQGGVEPWRTTLYADGATLLTHAESIALFDALGADFTPELKAPVVEMPYRGFSQSDYAQKLIDAYKAAGIAPERVWPQSFSLDDVLYWIDNEPAFGTQAVYLVEWTEGFDEQDPATWGEDFAGLAERGVNYLAPSINMLLTNADGEIAASAYAEAARDAGLELIAWSLERSGPLADGGGWYFRSIADLIDGDEDYLRVVDALARDVGVAGIFSDWPATVTYYANCRGL